MHRHWMKGALLALVLSTTPVLAQNTTNDVARRDVANNMDRDFNLGWLGLAGLVGLFGLMSRDRHDYGNRTTTRAAT